MELLELNINTKGILNTNTNINDKIINFCS